MEKKIDTLNWKIKKFERVLLSETNAQNSVNFVFLLLFLYDFVPYILI